MSAPKRDLPGIHILAEPLGVFMILCVSPFLFFIYPDRRNTVAAVLKMVSPVQFCSKVFPLLDNYCCFPFIIPINPAIASFGGIIVFLF
jgi:hypothetical protein